MTSKQRAHLRKLANGIDTILMVGKVGVTENTLKEVEDAITARELIKGKVLDNSLLSAREVAEEIATETKAQVVQVIGSKFVLYRQNPEKRKIELK